MQLVRSFPSSEIPRPLEAGSAQFDGPVGWELTEADVAQLTDLEGRFGAVTVEIIEPLVPTAIWTVHRIYGCGPELSEPS